MRQLVLTSLIKLCLTCGEEKIFSTIKVLKDYEHDCLQNFVLLFLSFLTALVVKNSHILV